MSFTEVLWEWSEGKERSEQRSEVLMRDPGRAGGHGPRWQGKR